MQTTNEKVLFNVRNQPITILQIISVVFFVGNLWMATQLFPLIRNIDSVVSRVNAIENRNGRADTILDDYLENRAIFKQTADNVEDIKKSLNIH